MIQALQVKDFDPARRLAFAWRRGELAARLFVAGLAVSVLVVAASAWQARRLQHRVEALDRHVARLQSALASRSAAIRTAEPPDVVQALPDAPAVAQVMQTLQWAADKEGARVESLQADDHPATDTALGHLDLVLSIKAPYPSIIVVLQQVLDRYPGATLRQIELAHVAPTTTLLPMAPAPTGAPTALPSTTPSEARVLLSFWRRPAGVVHADAVPMPQPSAGSAVAGTAAASSARAASASGLAASAAASGVRPASGAR